MPCKYVRAVLSVSHCVVDASVDFEGPVWRCYYVVVVGQDTLWGLVRKG